jgi:hypothetical protein
MTEVFIPSLSRSHQMLNLKICHESFLAPTLPQHLRITLSSTAHIASVNTSSLNKRIRDSVIFRNMLVSLRRVLIPWPVSKLGDHLLSAVTDVCVVSTATLAVPSQVARLSRFMCNFKVSLESGIHTSASLIVTGNEHRTVCL